MLAGVVATIMAAALLSGGCVAPAVKYVSEKFTDTGDPTQGIAYYIGGAGPFGSVGSFDVPAGLHDAGFRGKTEIFPWQSVSHAVDQVDLARNRVRAMELAEQISAYHRRHPRQPIYIVALSAGTGIATFALEYLSEDIKIEDAAYLGCSMSATYDLTRALRRVRGKLYVVYSRNDPILNNLVRGVTGTVDGASGDEGVAGLQGFRLPAQPAPDTEKQYAKVVNVPWRYDFANTGYEGGHTDCTSRRFIARYVAVALFEDDAQLVGRHLLDAPSSRPPVGLEPSNDDHPTSRPHRPAEGRSNGAMPAETQPGATSGDRRRENRLAE